MTTIIECIHGMLMCMYVYVRVVRYVHDCATGVVVLGYIVVRACVDDVSVAVRIRVRVAFVLFLASCVCDAIFAAVRDLPARAGGGSKWTQFYVRPAIHWPY